MNDSIRKLRDLRRRPVEWQALDAVSKSDLLADAIIELASKIDRVSASGVDMYPGR